MRSTARPCSSACATTESGASSTHSRCGSRVTASSRPKHFRDFPMPPLSPSRCSTSIATKPGPLALGSMRYAQDRGTDVHLVPGLALPDADLQAWTDHNDRILEAACAANGSTDIDRLPILALVAPGAKAIASADRVLDRLLDYPIAGVYVQATNLKPTQDSVEKLATFVQFLDEIRKHELPVVIGRVGAFGLILQALGLGPFDSGLGHAEAHELANLNRIALALV